ncbi:uncharacterized protein B0H18DRAFT_1113612 [Fomitopsis serialis]|uniref:uncharacterized protein n=1 Tax=Fomitopsis serialis TaxID=139415 RepID=UPI0020074BAA|nr:uncharacterized protein B0H18DRAFT_1113612 [Neoantrodia serialis]KAH9936179.1 hypothetical protein B0H18DRAFT_1113612 [Neoantrodia serialis]
MYASPSKNRYSAEEKKQLLANLDLEGASHSLVLVDSILHLFRAVQHRTEQIEAWLADSLENFRLRHEGQISRIPRVVRDITLKEFAKYNGNVQECVKAMARDALGTGQNGMDRTALKRKWAASQEEANAAAGPSTGAGSRDAESSRGLKSEETSLYDRPWHVQKPRFAVPKTPGTARPPPRMPSTTMPSPSPHKVASGKPSLFSKPSSRPVSPSKLPSPSKGSHPNHYARVVRPPSTTTFNPVLPPQPRWPRMDESMMSVNGSPLANPYQLGLNGYMKTVAGAEGDALDDTDGSDTEPPRPLNGLQTLKKKSSIIIRSSSSHLSQSGHSRSNSQSSLAQSQASRPPHSRNTSQTSTNGFVPARTNHQPNGEDASGPTTLLSLSALVSVPTKDGHVLEFDPFRTSPEEIDALDGITDSAKKQAKEDMARLIQAAMDRWKIS